MLNFGGVGFEASMGLPGTGVQPIFGNTVGASRAKKTAPAQR